MTKRLVYADNAATTPIRPQVLEEMMPWLTEGYGNASSLYRLGGKSAAAIEKAREQVAAAIGAAHANEIYFTSGGTESDNWALRGICEAKEAQGKHLITSAIEHHAILHTCQYLEKKGWEVTYLPVDEYGLVSPADLEKAIRPDTVLVSVMYANNEIGTVQPIAELAAIAKARGVLFHTDAVQAVGHTDLNVVKEGIDLLSISGHKLGSQKGIGALYVRRGIKLPNLLFGGAQEKGHRPGTENVAAIVGFGKAIELAEVNKAERLAEVARKRDRLMEGLLTVPYTRLNGHPTKRLPGNLNVSFRYVEGESIILQLDLNGISASSGSACTSGSLDPSHVLLAIGLPHEIAHGSLRLTLDENNTDEDVDYILEVVPRIIQKLRDMSPLYEEVAQQNRKED